MADLQHLEQQIRQKLHNAEERIQEERQAIAREMSDLERRQEKFDQLAARIIPSVIQPRLEKLAECFENATVTAPQEGVGYHWVCTFAHTPRFPASVQLDVGIGHDDRVENLLLLYTLEILPVFFRFERQHQQPLPLDQVEDETVADWIDARILEFVDTYLKIGQLQQYQREVVVTDPVCGMQVARSVTAAQETFEGRTYYFCTESCHQKFCEAPAKYVSSKSQSQKQNAAARPARAAKETASEERQLDQLKEEIRDANTRVEKRYGKK